jgi:UMF1 family MFS transporter
MTDQADVKQKKRAQWAWYFYDFGNSAYAAVVTLAVYSAYFKQVVVGTAQGSALWGLALTISMLVVAVVSPIMGALADYSGRKKEFLIVMTAISVVFTGLLFFIEKGEIFWGMVLLIIAEIGYRTGQVFYNSLLIDVAEEDDLAKVSGNGWAFGSFGGIICLLIILPLIMFNPGNSGIIRLSLLITAIYFAVFAIPAFLFIKEKHRPQAKEGKSYLGIAIDRLKKTISSVKDFKEFIKFMIAVLIYNDGIIAALEFAAIIGAVVFGVTNTELIIFVIVIQITNVAGAFFYGMLGEKFGYKKSLINSLILMTLSVIGMMFAPNKMAFFIVGSIAGFAMAGVQSLDRTLVSVFAPAHKNAEFYGFFSLTGRTSSIIGPGVMGLAASGLSAWVLNSMVKANLVTASNPQALALSEMIGHRMALVTIVLFLLVGMMPLLFVNEAEGRKAARNSKI